ncbi:MAG: NAD(P)-binding domain-containing protein, partial [Rhizobiales bacterium]|nr:NAD(P)-binding domain-containing protein [Hyphomicrobiales bacterium]
MTLPLRTIGIIGAGQMGNGIAHVCALAGYEVLLHDLNEERLKAGLATINGNMARQVSRGLIDEAKRAAALEKIQPETDVAVVAQADLVIEAATENEEIKKKIFQSLVPLLGADTMLATNTS